MNHDISRYWRGCFFFKNALAKQLMWRIGIILLSFIRFHISQLIEEFFPSTVLRVFFITSNFTTQSARKISFWDLVWLGFGLTRDIYGCKPSGKFRTTSEPNFPTRGVFVSLGWVDISGHIFPYGKSFSYIPSFRWVPSPDNFKSPHWCITMARNCLYNHQSFIGIQLPTFELQTVGVSKNRCTPKSSILIGFSAINHPFWGLNPPIFGSTPSGFSHHMMQLNESPLFPFIGTHPESLL